MQLFCQKKNSWPVFLFHSFINACQKFCAYVWYFNGVLEQNFCARLWLWWRRLRPYLFQACDIFKKPPCFARWVKEGLSLVDRVLMNMWDTAGFSLLHVKQISATLPSSIIIQPPVLFHATKIILYQSPKAVLSFLCLLSALAFPLSDKLRFPSSPATCSSGLPPPAPTFHLNALEQNFCALIWLWEGRTGS